MSAKELTEFDRDLMNYADSISVEMAGDIIRKITGNLDFDQIDIKSPKSVTLDSQNFMETEYTIFGQKVSIKVSLWRKNKVCFVTIQCNGKEKIFNNSSKYTCEDLSKVYERTFKEFERYFKAKYSKNGNRTNKFDEACQSISDKLDISEEEAAEILSEELNRMKRNEGIDVRDFLKKLPEEIVDKDFIVRKVDSLNLHEYYGVYPTSVKSMIARIIVSNYKNGYTADIVRYSPKKVSRTYIKDENSDFDLSEFTSKTIKAVRSVVNNYNKKTSEIDKFKDSIKGISIDGKNTTLYGGNIKQSQVRPSERVSTIEISISGNKTSERVEIGFNDKHKYYVYFKTSNKVILKDSEDYNITSLTKLIEKNLSN